MPLILWILFPLAVSGAQERPTGFKVVKTHGGHALHVGDRVNLGDKITTTAGQEVELDADDKSKLLVTENSEIILSNDEHAVQTVELNRGKIVGLANKPNSKVSPSPNAPKPRYRFLIRTSTATMGVRGTQFIVENSEKDKHSHFYVLEGVVDIAKNVTDLLTDNFVVAQAGQLVDTASDGIGLVADQTKKAAQFTTETLDSGVRGVSKAIPFDVLGFLADINKSLPVEFHIPFLTSPQAEDRTSGKRFNLGCFELFTQGYFSNELPADRQSYGVGLSWDPTLHLTEHIFDLRGHIGLPRLMRGAQSAFEDWEFKILATRVFKNLIFAEIGPTLQLYKGDKTGFGLSVSGGIWFGDRPLLSLLERVFLGVNCLDSPYPACEYRFGIGASVF